MVTVLLSYSLIISSAAVYAASFFFIDYCWWGSFVFLIPLFFIQFRAHKELLFGAGVWSLIAYSSHILTAVDVVHKNALTWHAYSSVLVVVLFFFVLTYGWFYACYYVQNTPYYTERFVFFAFLHTWIIHNFFFYAGGIPYGYPLAFPLLPFFTFSPQVQHICYGIGIWALLFVVYLAQVLVLENKKVSLMLVVGLVGWWAVINYWYPVKKTVHSFVCSVNPVYESNGQQQFYRTQQALEQAGHDNPSALVYLLPESSVPFDYKKISYLSELLTDDAGLSGKTIIFGTHDIQHDKKFNCVAYTTTHGRIRVGYVKKRLVPLFEYNYFKKGNKKGFFLEKNNEFCSDTNAYEPLFIDGIGYFYPSICSEAVWHFPRGQPFCVMVILHDGHFSFNFIKRILRTYIEMQAIRAGVSIIYSSYKMQK